MNIIASQKPVFSIVSVLLLAVTMLFVMAVPAGVVSANGNPTLTVSGSVTYIASGTPVLIAPSLLLTGGNIDFIQILISGNFSSGDDYLGIQSTGAATSGTVSGIDFSYSNTTGVMTLQNSATADTYQSVLRQVTFFSISLDPSTATRTVDFSIGSGLFNADTGHFYEFVSSVGIQWDNANLAANALHYYGLQGYLTTVTSQAENDFIKSKLVGEGWMGASDLANESDWYWVTGPESGTYFFHQTKADPSSVNLVPVYGGQTSGGGDAVDGLYNGWLPNEPNDWGSGEDYAHFRADGGWNDYPIYSDAIQGYVVEYGGMEGDPTLQLTGSVTVNVTEPDMCVEGNGTGIVNGDVTPSVSDDTDFGSTGIDTGTVAHTFTITNSGTADLTLDGDPKILLGGDHAADFSVTTDASSPVAAAGSTTFQITFNPGALGIRTASVTISNNDADNNPYTFTIQGTGLLSLTVTSITANNKYYDGTTAATLNTGGAALVGVIPDDDVTLDTAGASGAFLTANPGNGKTVIISGLTIGGTDAGSYSLVQPTTIANILIIPVPPPPSIITSTTTETVTSTTTTEPPTTTSTTALTLQVNVEDQTNFAAISAEGEVQGNTVVTSSDGKITLNIPSGTFVLEGNAPPLQISITPDDSVPPPPPGTNIIGIPYECLPDGTTFNPPITITWQYDPATLPPGTDETRLKVAFYNKVTGTWEVIEGIVDTVNHTVTASISHFSNYAVFAPAAATPASTVLTTASTVLTATSSVSTTTTIQSQTQPVIPTSTPAKTNTISTWLIVAIIIVAVVVILLIVLMITKKK